MKPIIRVSLPLLCAAFCAATTLSPGAAAAFYRCTSASLEEAGVKFDCLGADKASEGCEVFEMPLAELTESSGSYRHAEASEKDSRRFIDDVSTMRATGAFTETEAMAGVLGGKTVGVCTLHEGWPQVDAYRISVA